MKLLSKLFFSKLDFTQQLILTFSVGIACLAIISSLVISSISSQTVYNQLLEQGQKITDNFAEQSTLALLYRSPDIANEAANTTLAFPDITGVGIYTPNRKPLFESDVIDQEREPNITWPTQQQLHFEDTRAWYYWAPVYAGNAGADTTAEADALFSTDAPLKELVGFVHVVMTKDTLNAMTRQILQSNLLTSMGLALLLLFFLLAITKRVTQPLKDLAEAMGYAQRGKTAVRADLHGPKDIIHMETAFNTMMKELESREQELKRARDTALASARVKGEFAATVSHELRTPMNGVMGMLELLHGMGLTDKQEEYVKIARNSGEALLVLIDEILDFSKIESGKMRLHAVDVKPREMLSDVSELLSTQARQKKLRIKTLIADEVPEAVRGDAGRIRQVLINLTGNALKFTERGEVTLRLSLSQTDDQRKTLYFEVEDTGIGIPNEAQQRIFEAFAQVDSSTTRKYGGTGLGLAICYQLVELMGGKLGVQSEEGKGSVFWFTVPLEAPLGDGLDDRVDLSKMAGLRVLIVSASTQNPHPLVQTFMGWESFQRQVAGCVEAYNMLKAASAQGKPYDIVIVDSSVDERSALTLAAQVRSGPTLAHTQTIILSDNDPFLDGKNKALGNWLPANPSTVRLFKTISHLMLLKSHTVSGRKPGYKSEHPVHAAHVLIVEDNSANQQVALGMLDRLGHRAQVAGDGQAALALMSQCEFDLILMDCLMPGMDGYEATRRIRSQERTGKHIPIIAMTANLRPEDQKRCLDVGMDDFVGKPLNLDVLEEKLVHWLTANAAKPKPITLDPAPTEAAPAAAPEALPTLDEEVITKLRLKVGKAFPTMLAAFLNDTPKHLDRLNRAVSAKDALQIRNIAHGIKGSASNLGAHKIAHYCELLESMGARREIADAAPLMDSVNQEYRLLQSQLEQHQSSQSEEEPAALVLENQPRILIVDDDNSARLALHGVLERDGYNIFEAKNGAEAIAICERELPDLVLMDAMMPKLDGFIACQQIQQLNLPSTPPILMITALQDEKSIEKAFSSGATDFIPKPVNLTVLRKRIARLLKTSRAEKHVHQLSYYDVLTNLPNRTLFIERSTELLLRAEEKHQMVALMFLDLDRFKLINDTQGHDAGDLLLKTVALRLQGSVRTGDLVARLGGDEFVVVLDDVHSPEVVAKVAEKICRTLVQPFAFMQQQVYVSTSIGIAIYPQNGSNIGTLMKHADTAMFRAKAKGGGCFQFYEYGMETEISRQVELESELRRALERNELVLHYQPQADLRTGRLVGMEALVRWRHPQRGLLAPAEFIPLAEESGLINNLGDWVLLNACRQQQAWLKQGITPLPVAVNMSGRQLEGDLLLPKIKRVLAETGIPHHLLRLEITEDTLADNNSPNIRQLQELKNIGIALAIDDFGTGYSSLSYLKRFPVEILKIDRGFVKDLPHDSDSAAIISGIIALGHSLGKKIVAEGVETQEQREFLKKEGCDIEQGFLLSRPMPVQELECWLREQKQNLG